MSEMILRPPKGAVKKKKIVGRGDSAGKGSTCGRGHKGQKARSGGGVRPGFEGGQMPLYRRVARRGFSNYPFKKTFVAVNLNEIEKRYTDGESVTLETLAEKNLIKSTEMDVKILGNGEIKKKLTVDGLKISGPAKEKIEKAGGTVKAAVSEKNAVKKSEGKAKDKEGQE